MSVVKYIEDDCKSNNLEKQYFDNLRLLLDQGILNKNRTGIKTYTYPHIMIRHDMSNGFPLITTKKMAWKTMKVELEFFIKGLTDKKWLQERGCKIWNEWCNPKKIPEGLNDQERKKIQLKENDLGKIYGYQWRNFNSQKVDQLKWITDELKTNPNNRQLVCSAWNPVEKPEMALPPCHIMFHVFVLEDKLNLSFMMRSIDSFLGFPFNIASYGLLLHLLSKETGLKEGILTGFLSNWHLYENHVESVKKQLIREPYELPTIKTDNFDSIFNWTYNDTELLNYNYHPSIKAEIAI